MFPETFISQNKINNRDKYNIKNGCKRNIWKLNWEKIYVDEEKRQNKWWHNGRKVNPYSKVYKVNWNGKSNGKR